MDEPSCSLTRDTITVHVQSPPISETVTSILPQLLPILWIVNHPPQSVVAKTDDVANIVEPRSVSAHSLKVIQLPTATTDCQNSAETAATAGTAPHIGNVITDTVALGKLMYDDSITPDDANKKAKTM